MKKKPSILRQLLLNILLPVLVVIISLSGISYYLNHQKLNDSNELLKKQIVGEAKSLLSMYDESLQMIEQDLEVRMTEVSKKLHDNYFKTTDSINTADLYRISIEMGVDTAQESIYIINRNGIITNTTYRPDKNLNFYKVDTGFQTFFRKVWQKNELMIDRFGGEMSTGKIKKYSFYSTNDQQYIIELGFYSKKANTMSGKIRENINGIRKNFPNISKIAIYVAAADMEIGEVPKRHYVAYTRAIKQKKPVQVIEEKNGMTWYHDYVYLNIEGAKLYSGYILQIVSNDSRERELISGEIKRFIIIFLLTVIPLTLLIYFRSRAITRPIRLLTQKAEIISKGNLEERVPVEGAYEIAQLSGNFNTMVNELQELYKGLEEKVRVRTMELQHQKEIMQEKNKEILDSINYAQRIQQALLPDEAELQLYFPESFVLFKPKDIVSGDYYWITQKDNNIFYATADCTGHGVPGGFMSMLGSSFLNELVNEKEITEPAEILNSLRERVMSALRQTGSVGENKDGMDIVLCRIDKNKKELVYAAANNGFYLVRNGEIHEYKPDKMPIGHYFDMKPFSQRTISLMPGDSIYTFTDGYADQFGGPKGKKFKYLSLNKLILENSAKTMREQCNILSSTYEEWKGSFEQTDDVCVIGVRV